MLGEIVRGGGADQRDLSTQREIIFERFDQHVNINGSG